MIIKGIAIILAVALILPFGIGISAGLNKKIKVGVFITILGLCIIFISNHMYPKYIIPYSTDIEAYEHGVNVRKWLLKGTYLGLVTSAVGATTAYLAAIIQAWEKRQMLLPFLFSSGKKG